MTFDVLIKIQDVTNNNHITVFEVEDTFNILLDKFMQDKGWVTYNIERNVKNYFTDEDGYNEVEVSLVTILKLFGYDSNRIKQLVKDKDPILHMTRDSREFEITKPLNNVDKDEKVDIIDERELNVSDNNHNISSTTEQLSDIINEDS